MSRSPEAIAAKHAEIARRYRKAKPGGRRLVNLARLRVTELGRLFNFRHRAGVLPDTTQGHDDAEVAVHHLVRTKADPRDRVLAWLELRAPWMSPAAAEDIFAAAVAMPLRWTADKIAARLRVTVEEREALCLTTIGAIGQTKADRQERRARRKRERERERRYRAGAMSREAYERVGLAVTKPWKDAGVDRSTWYRRLKKRRPKRATSPCTPYLSYAGHEPVAPP